MLLGHSRCFAHREHLITFTVAFPALVGEVLVVDHIPASVADSDQAAHLPDSFPTVVGAADILAHTFDKGAATVVGVALVASFACSQSWPGAR